MRLGQISLNIWNQQSRDGEIRLLARKEALLSGGKPVVVMLHGALRNSAPLVPWLPALERDFELLFIDLPGHGQAPELYPVSVENFARNIGDAISSLLAGREVMVIGESLGGLIALCLGGLDLPMLRCVFAADPPLSMAKQWQVTHAVREHAKAARGKFWTEFAFNIFGVTEDGLDPADRIYYPLLQRLAVPACILTGDVPLFPVRASAATPCLIDAVDEDAILRYSNGKAVLRRVEGCGHLVLTDALSASLTHFRQFARDRAGTVWTI